MRRSPAPLYRKVNTLARGVHHNVGGEARWTRARDKVVDAPRAGMAQGKRRGLDYTPLYRFLQSRVGRPWAEVHSEAVARLPEAAPIWYIVAADRDAARAIVRTGETSFWTGLFVDEAGTLRRVEPAYGPSDLPPLCPCCTYTMNGVRFTRRFPGHPSAYRAWRRATGD